MWYKWVHINNDIKVPYWIGPSMVLNQQRKKNNLSFVLKFNREKGKFKSTKLFSSKREKNKILGPLFWPEKFINLMQWNVLFYVIRNHSCNGWFRLRLRSVRWFDLSYNLCPEGTSRFKEMIIKWCSFLMRVLTANQYCYTAGQNASKKMSDF